MIIKMESTVPIVSGPDAVKRTGMEMRSKGLKKAFIICDEGVQNAGIVDKVTDSLTRSGIEFMIYNKVLPDPPDTMVNEAGTDAREYEADCIVGVGGGSSLDTAKMVRMLMDYPPPVTQYTSTATPATLITNVPLIAIPTTAGTGSEATSLAVVTNTANGTKVGLASPIFLPDIAIIDPKLFVGLPAGITNSCAFDAFTHCFDSVIGPSVEPFTNIFTKEGLRIIREDLPPLLDDLSNLDLRYKICQAATLGGLAITTNFCHHSHAIGHSIGAVFHKPHGWCTVFCMPQLVRIYAQWEPEKTIQALESFGVEVPEGISNDELGELGSREILDFMKLCKVPTMKDLDIDREKLLEVVPGMCPRDAAGSGMPFALSAGEYREIIADAYDNN